MNFWVHITLVGLDGFTLNFTFLGKRGVKNVQSMKSRLFQFEAVQRSRARHIPDPQNSNLGVWQTNKHKSVQTHYRSLSSCKYILSLFLGQWTRDLCFLSLSPLILNVVFRRSQMCSNIKDASVHRQMAQCCHTHTPPRQVFARPWRVCFSLYSFNIVNHCYVFTCYL